MSMLSRQDLEEERRLFYVAVTRAMKSCTLTYTGSRFVMGKLLTSEPSRFIDEINPAFLNRETMTRGGGRSLMGNTPTLSSAKSGGLNRGLGNSAPNLKSLNDVQRTKSAISSSENLDIKVGYNVEHKQFGRGKVTHLLGSGADKKATIFFPHHGSKTVLLRYANLTVLEE
jgi:DNA helicase-2/ATP-dependent DNA helicase PcrA